jgi:hypothetical protein
MAPHLPGKTIKQIRDKRREEAYKKLLTDLSGDDVEATCFTEGLREDGRTNDDVPQGSGPSHAVLETETGAGNYRDTNPETIPSLRPPRLERPPSVHINDEGWTAEFAKQTLNEIPSGDTSTLDYSELRNRLTSALEKVRDGNALPTQLAVDDLYSSLVSYIL